MTGVLALRKRLPLVVFLLLVVLLLMLVGFACACLSEHPMLAVERALSVLVTPVPVVQVWSSLIATLAAAALLVSYRLPVRAASPAVLQRFLL